jgi:N-acetylglutamate synthase-like GNAT family acetyltransferase
MQLHIRPYRPNDKASCLTAFKSNVPLYFTKGEIADFDHFLDNFHNPDNTKGYITTCYDVVELDGQIIGCGGYGCKDGGETASFAWGLIHADWHKKGFGKFLLIHRLHKIQLAFPTLPIVLDTTQHSYSFFQKFGFEITKITPDFYEKEMHRYDMTWRGGKIDAVY